MPEVYMPPPSEQKGKQADWVKTQPTRHSPEVLQLVMPLQQRVSPLQVLSPAPFGQL
jgi:hypothetical protein